ncbi:MAG: RpiR family transcriptional regulator [Herminiimonas sp.]|jgi:RpiR family carbohydrate utilization transcriptional regulator|nr:RpiR family transcriptional regulator [Herminiimonas sp.]
MEKVQFVPGLSTNPLERLRAEMDALPTASRKAAQVFLDNAEWAVRASVDDLARRAQVSAPTIVRLCRTLGFSGLTDFKLQLAQSLAVGTPYLHRVVSSTDSVSEMIHKILFGAAAFMTNLEEQIDVAMMDSAIEKIAAARRVDCYSVGNTSTSLANDAQGRFFRLGLTSNSYFDAHMQLISAASLGTDGVVLAISHVGQMPTLLEAVDVAREQGATVIGLTQPDTPLARHCTIPLTVSIPEDAVVRVGTESYLAHLALIEILMVGVGIRRGPDAIEKLKRARDVLKAHPAAKWVWAKAV